MLHHRDSGLIQPTKLIHVTHNTQKLKEKNMMISLDDEKAFDRIQHPFMKKSWRYQGCKDHI